MSYVACGRSLVRNSPRGWAPKTLPSPEVRVGRAKARGSIVGRHVSTGARKVLGNRVLATASASPRCSGSGRGRRRHHATALLPLNRIVVRDLGVHPRGEFRTSGAAVGQIDTWAAVAAFLFERGGLSEQRGWAPRSPPREPPREPEGEPCARCEVRGAKECPAWKRTQGGNSRRTFFVRRSRDSFAAEAAPTGFRYHPAFTPSPRNRP
jgi:hypothetical protein